MEIYIKKFNSLSLNELFAIVRARERVFHLEQKVTEEDFDEVDKISYHIYLMHEKRLLGYIRLYGKDEEYHLGRFLTLERHKGYGKKVFEAALRYAYDKLKAKRIIIHAQSYLIDFYKKYGFKVEGEPFEEAGIEHVKMILEK